MLIRFGLSFFCVIALRVEQIQCSRFAGGLEQVIVLLAAAHLMDESETLAHPLPASIMQHAERSIHAK